MPSRIPALRLAPGLPAEGRPLPPDFYTHPNAEYIARALLGKVLCTALEGGYTSGIIVETEAYKGSGDAACHSHLGRHTERTAVMYRPGGLAYVYLCYGLHHLFNIVAGPEGQADAVLVRAAEPLEGLDQMAARRRMAPGNPALLRGPGALSQGLGISKAQNGQSLTQGQIWIEDRGLQLPGEAIRTGPRIGVDYAGADALLPWRYWVAGSRYVSAKRS